MKVDALPLKLSRTFPTLKTINNPTVEQLREWARPTETTTDIGSPAFFTRRVGSRSAKSTFFIEEGVPLSRHQNKADPELARRIIETVEGNMGRHEWIQLDRAVGSSPKARFHVRLLITKDMAHVALLWCQTLFPASKAETDPKKEPDILSVYCPDWLEGVASQDKKDFPEKIILCHPGRSINYILGVDYVGECKMSFLRLAMLQMKLKGGLGLHAGSKSLRVKTDKGVEDIGFLLFGLSGTGKTTLTLEDHGLRPPEGVTILQDDIVLIDRGGAAYGTENNFYVKTEGLTREGQPGLYNALMDKSTVFENVEVDAASHKILFEGYKHGTNGRALALRSRLPNTSNAVDLPKTHKLIFITRRDTIIPPVARLDRLQAIAYFMLGESIETSAGDPTRAGQPKHEVGFNPFIIGPEEEEANRLLDILEANPHIEVYLLNTGNVGKGADAPGFDPKGFKITKDVSSLLIQFIARQKPGDAKNWTKDPDWGYLVPKDIAGIGDFSRYQPKRHYSAQTYARLVDEMKKERREYLSRFPGLDSEIRGCI